MEDFASEIRLSSFLPEAELRDRTRLSTGTMAISSSVNGVAVRPGARAPAMPWRAPSNTEWENLRARPPTRATFNPQSLVNIVRAPVEFTELMSRMMDPLRVEEGIARSPRKVRELLALPRREDFGAAMGALWPLCRSVESIECIGFRVSAPGFPTLTCYGGDGRRQILGLHIDFLEPGSEAVLDERVRLCINVGPRPRVFLFVNRSLEELATAVTGTASDARSFNWRFGPRLADEFLSLHSGFPVVGVRLDPGYGYIAPTNAIIHDATCPPGAEMDDISFQVLGHFVPQELNSNTMARTARSHVAIGAPDPAGASAREALVLAPGLAFNVVGGGLVETRVRGKTVQISMDAFEAAIAFSAPCTVADAFESAQDKREATFVTHIDALREAGILEPFADPEASILDLLNPATFSDPSLLDGIGKALAAGRAVAIPNAFREPMADGVFDALNASDAWTVQHYYHPSRPFFQFRHQGIYEPCDLPPAARDVATILGSTATKRLLGNLADCDVHGRFHTGASLYHAGDYSLPHNDSCGLRSLTYIWYLSRDWQSDWGGHFVWCPSGAMLNPGFNTLLLFKVTRESLHFVSPVAPMARGKRLTLTGFWQRSAPAADARPGAVRLEGMELCEHSYGSPVELVRAGSRAVAL